MANLILQSSNKKLLPAIVEGKTDEVRGYLMRYKSNTGVVRYDQTLQIPSKERIPALVRADRAPVVIAITASLQKTFDLLNLRKGCNEDQVIELAEMIIDSAHEDNLSLEDVLLFLQQLLTGKAGKIFDRMDIPTFFELFEGYRQERHLALQYIQYEANANYKAMGDTTRTSEQLDKGAEGIHEALKDRMKKMYGEEKSI